MASPFCLQLITMLQDRHSEGTFLPSVDNVEDYELIAGMEDATGTTLRFKRKLDTCDDQDMVINVSYIISGSEVHGGAPRIYIPYGTECVTQSLDVSGGESVVVACPASTSINNSPAELASYSGPCRHPSP